MLDRGTVREQEGTLLVGISPSSSGIICVLPASAVLEDKAVVSSHRVGQADSEAVSSAWHGTFTIQAARPFRGKDKQVNESTTQCYIWEKSEEAFECLSSLGGTSFPGSANILQKPLMALSCSRCVTEQVFVGPHQCFSVWYYRSSASSRFCPVDTGSSKGHFFPTEDRRLYELYDSYKCRTWTLWPYSSTRYTFTALHSKLRETR